MKHANPHRGVSSITFESLEQRELMAAHPFKAPTLVPTGGTDPQGLLTADVNSDGKLDIVVTNSTAGTVGVMLGKGNGKFSAPKVFDAGSALSSVAVGDFNGDKKLDLVVAGDDLAIFTGRGDGRFNLLKRLNDLALPQSVAVGDLNGDGLSDIAVTDVYSSTVSLVLNQGSGKFAEPTKVEAGLGPCGLALADFNGDKKLDMVVTNMGEFAVGMGIGVGILYGKGDGIFGAPVSYAGFGRPVAVSVGDLNGDKKLDFSVVNSGFGNFDGLDTMTVYLQGKTGAFKVGKQYNVAPFPEGVTLADFNGDKKLDVITGNYGSNQMSFLAGNGNGTFKKPVNVAAVSGNAGVVASDLNGDGQLDLVTTSDQTSVAVLLHK